MANKVTNYREVKYDFDTKLNALHWDEFMREVNFTTFETPDDYYAVYENLDEPDDHDRKKYAVYLHSTSELICLMTDCGCVLDCCYDDIEYMEQRNELYKQIAMLAGWPEKLPAKRYTVRLHRILDVEIRAENDEQADKIGLLLANHNVLNYINSQLSLAWKANSTGEYDELGYVVPAIPESEGVWDLSLDEVDCKRILKGGI